MNKSPLLIFEFYCRDLVHLSFNLGYLTTLRAAYPTRKIYFYGEKYHLKALRDLGIGALDIELVEGPSHLLPNAPQKSFFEIEKSGHNCVSFMLERVNFHDAAFAATFGVTPDLLRAIRWRWRGKAMPPLDIVLHAQLMFLNLWRSPNPFRRFFDFPSEINRKSGSNVRFVALEKAIGLAMMENLKARSNDTVVFEHPIGSAVAIASAPVKANSKKGLRVGFLGVAGAGKGFPLFLRLSSSFASDVLSFHVIGRHDKDWKPSVQYRLSTLPKNYILPRDEYIEMAKTMDVICLPLDKERYDWIASGTLMDCIELGLPVVVSSTRVLEDLQSRYGPLGVICSQESDFFDFFENDPVTYLKNNKDSYLQNMKNIRTDRLPKNQAKLYPGLSLQHILKFGDNDG